MKQKTNNLTLIVLEAIQVKVKSEAIARKKQIDQKNKAKLQNHANNRARRLPVKLQPTAKRPILKVKEGN